MRWLRKLRANQPNVEVDESRRGFLLGMVAAGTIGVVGLPALSEAGAVPTPAEPEISTPIVRAWVRMVSHGEVHSEWGEDKVTFGQLLSWSLKMNSSSVQGICEAKSAELEFDGYIDEAVQKAFYNNELLNVRLPMGGGKFVTGSFFVTEIRFGLEEW